MGTQLCEDIQGVGMLRNQQEISWKHLSEQRRDGVLCDIMFHCNDGEVLAHKCVLASVSEYFRILFTSPISAASSTNTALLDGFSVEAITLLMEVVYSEVDVPAVHVVELLKLADYIQLKWLVDMLVEDIRNYIDETNVLEWFTIAKELGLEKLKFLCKCYIRENVELLPCEDVEHVIDSRVPNQLDKWEKDMSREVVMINTDKGHYLLDPKLASISKLNENCDAASVNGCKAKKNWEEKGFLETAFVFQDVVYLITRVTVPCDPTGNIFNSWSIYSVWKFQHISKNLDLVCVLKDSELKSRLVDDITKTTTNVSTSQLFYDSKTSLYILCTLRSVTGFGECVFKLDIRSFLFYEGYLLLDERQMYHLAYINEHGVCIVSPDYVLNLEKHAFEVPGFHAGALLKTEINQQVINASKNTDLPKSRVDDFYWETWKPVNKNGQFYCCVDDTTSDLNFILILSLNMEKRSWVICDSREFIFEEVFPRQMLFHSENTLYQHWMEENGTCQETSYLDEKESTFKSVDFFPATVYKDINSYVVFPYHILL